MVRLIALVALSLLFTDFAVAQEKEKGAGPDKKPEAKVDVSKEKTKEAYPERIKKDAPYAERQAKEAAKKEAAKSEGGGAKGRLSKIAVESGVLKLSVEGKEYEFVTTDNTLAVLRTVEKDGKQVVVGVQLFSGYGGEKYAEKKEAVKKDQPKYAGDKPAEKKEAVKKDQPKYAGDKPAEKKEAVKKDQPKYAGDKPAEK